MLRAFCIDDFAVATAPRGISIYELAHKTNKSFGIIPDKMLNITVVIADNKPADSPVNNIFWREIDSKPYQKSHKH